jgi:hypothetical protein
LKNYMRNENTNWNWLHEKGIFDTLEENEEYLQTIEEQAKKLFEMGSAMVGIFVSKEHRDAANILAEHYGMKPLNKFIVDVISDDLHWMFFHTN